MDSGGRLVRVRRLLANPWLRVGAVLVSVGVALWSLDQAPRVSLAPLLPAVAAWVIGKYLLCALRWRALTDDGLSRRWYLRAYAEGELLGLLSPAHVGADLWRTRRLVRAGRPVAVAAGAVGFDRFVGAGGLVIAALAAGVVVHWQVTAVLLGAAVVVFAVAWFARSRWRIRVPGPRSIGYGLLLSLVYQATVAGLLLGALAALDHRMAPLKLVGVYAASQLAGLVPGVHGASPREAALAGGLAALGAPWPAAVGAVALMASLAWLPALLFGGTSLLATWLAVRTGRWRPRPAPCAGPASGTRRTGGT